MEIKTGDIILVQTNSTLGNLIQKFQKKEYKDGYQYNHAMTAWWNYGELWVIEATEDGAVATPLSDYMKNKKYVSIVGLRPKFEVDGSEWGKFMLSLCGRLRYGFFKLLITMPIYILTDVWIGRNKPSKHQVICGVLCAHIANHFYFDLFPREERVMPAELYNHKEYTRYTIK